MDRHSSSIALLILSGHGYKDQQLQLRVRWRGASADEEEEWFVLATPFARFFDLCFMYGVGFQRKN